MNKSIHPRNIDEAGGQGEKRIENANSDKADVYTIKESREEDEL
jgi:hypothetical protein